MKSTKVLIAVESQFLSDVFADVLSSETDITIAGHATTFSKALQFVYEKEADVALISIQLPGALDLIYQIKEIAPSIKVLALGLLDIEDQVLKYVEAGAVGYILQDSSVHELIEAVHLAQREEAKISSRVAAALFDRLSKISRYFARVDSSLLEENTLTKRELEVLDFIGLGFSNQEIASRLILEVGTVKNHVHNILKKLNVNSREEAATYLAFIKK